MQTTQINKADVMVVDDIPANLQLLEELLGERGYNVRPLPSGQMALRSARKRPPDIILLDVNMPVMNGYETCVLLKEDPVLRNIPVLFVSAMNEAFDKVKAFQAGGVDYITKPFEINELNARISTHLKIKKYQTQLETYKNELELKVQKQCAIMLQQSRLAQMGEMISMIAHQWRQPLSSISTISSTLTMDVMLDEYKKEFFQERLEMISDLSQHLSSTIDDFRSFFKESKGKESSSLTKIAEESIKIIKPSFTTTQITLHTLYETSDEINTYPNELKQVVLNLLKNAEDILLEKEIKDPQIWITCYSKEDATCLSIQDNGGGIDKGIIQNIFDPYFSTKKRKDGTGLGLYMSKTIIEEHCNGSLDVINAEHGALFTITLPLISEAE